MKKFYNNLIVLFITNLLFITPVMALDLDSTVTDKSRQTYTSGATAAQKTVKEVGQIEVKPEIKQDLPKVPNLPAKANSLTVPPINTVYSGKVPDSNAFIPCDDIKTSDLIIDKSFAAVKPSKTTKIAMSASSKNFRTAKLPKGTQFRVINQTKINDYLTVGQSIVFLTTQDYRTPYFNIPKNTKLNARIVDIHRPQMTCNGGLVKIKLVSANINGYTQQIDGGIIKLKTDNIYFNNLKGNHTYCKNVSKKAKWGRTKFAEWSKTSKELANDGPLIILSPFPYIGGCLMVAGSTISSPVTALLGKGDPIAVPPNTAFTLKLYNDANIRY